MKTKEELKEEYKKLVHPKGVYKVTCTANGKIFVGGSPNLDSRWENMKFQLNSHTFPNSELQADWNKYGETSFSYEILDMLKFKEGFDPKKNYNDEIKELEELYLDELQPFDDKGYNRRKR